MVRADFLLGLELSLSRADEAVSSALCPVESIIFNVRDSPSLIFVKCLFKEMRRLAQPTKAVAQSKKAKVPPPDHDQHSSRPTVLSQRRLLRTYPS